MNALIETAVAPLRSTSAYRMTEMVYNRIEKVLAAIEAADGNLNALFPRMSEKRQHATKITKPAGRRTYCHRDHDNVVADQDGIERLLTEANKLSDLTYDEYVAKLSAKTHVEGDEIVGAELVHEGGVWYSSDLFVTHASGNVVRWRTTMICNYSKHGRPFNQFPTRKIKG